MANVLDNIKNGFSNLIERTKNTLYLIRNRYTNDLQLVKTLNDKELYSVHINFNKKEVLLKPILKIFVSKKDIITVDYDSFINFVIDDIKYLLKLDKSSQKSDKDILNQLKLLYTLEKTIVRVGPENTILGYMMYSVDYRSDTMYYWYCVNLVRMHAVNENDTETLDAFFKYLVLKSIDRGCSIETIINKNDKQYYDFLKSKKFRINDGIGGLSETFGEESLNTEKHLIKNMNGFYEKDLTFLFKSKSLEEVHNKINELQKDSKKQLTDYEILDKLSNGRGTEAYQKLSQYRLQSKEYYSAFQFVTNKKVNKLMDLKTKEGLNMHIFRNKNQYKKAPRNLKSMMKFVKAGFFIYEGYSPCHNIPHDQDNYEYRKKTLQLMLYCVRHNLLNKRNKWSTLGNISFRGRTNTSFEGCQFIYNDKTGKLVVDCHNRGTWDYGKHGTTAHFLYDISPWLTQGNGTNEETENLFIMDEKTENEYLNSGSDVLNNIMNNEPDDMKSTWENCIAFIKDIIDTKVGRSVEDIQTVYDGEVYLQEEKERVNAMRSQYIDEFIDKNEYRLETTYKPDYDKYKAFYTLVSSREFIDNYLPDYKEMICCGSPTSSKQAYNQFVGSLMRESLMNGAAEIKEGDKVDMKLENYELSFSSEYIDNINQKIQNHPIGLEVINEEYNKYIELITKLMNKAVSQFGMEFRLLDNNIEEHSKVLFTVKMTHTVTKEEAIILGKKNFTRGISDEEKPEYNVTVLEEEATENLNTYHTPEYLL